MREKVRIYVLSVIGLVVVFFYLSLGADIPSGYYDRARGLVGLELKAALHDIIKDNKRYEYGEVWDILKYTDEDPNNPGNVILLYSGWSKSKFANGGGPSQWNREHTWAKSHGQFGTVKGPGTDAHHLRPEDVTVNGKRGNLEFDNGGDLYTDPDGPTGCRVDDDSWEPRDAVKGDVARIMFYMAVRYEGEPGSNEPDLELNDLVDNGTMPLHGNLSTLLKWHVQDPVDAWERRRNDRIFEKQGNRNPFIDHPEYVGYTWKNEGPEPSDDTTAPVISNVTFKTGTAEATIDWTTDEPATSLVYYGKSCGSLNFVAHDGNYANQHTLVLANLEAGTDYYFNVSSTDKDCNGPVYSKVYSFKSASGGGGSGGGGVGTGMVISEIAANPAGSFNNEYIELYNASNQPIDIKTWDIIVHRKGAGDIVVRLGVTGDYQGTTVIPPGGFYIITRGTVGYMDKTMYDGFYLNRLFYVELKNGLKVMDYAGKENDCFLPDTNYEVGNVAADNSAVTAWIDKGGSYRGTAGSL